MLLGKGCLGLFLGVVADMQLLSGATFLYIRRCLGEYLLSGSESRPYFSNMDLCVISLVITEDKSLSDKG